MANRILRRAGSSVLVQKLVTKAVLENNLIEEGDRILIAVSGGKDSTVLSFALSSIRAALKKKYELQALHISSDFCACCKKTALLKMLSEWEIPFEDIFVPVLGRLKPGRKMNCYWCSAQRRTELISYAMKNNFNKIALGHHLDDILETYLMNMMNSGKFSGMNARLDYQKYPVSIIRPLAYLEERQVIACACEKEIIKSACTCPYGRNSKRIDIRKRISVFTSDSSGVKRRLLNALSSADALLRKKDSCGIVI